MVESIVTDLLSIHKIANTSLTTTPESVSQSNFFFTLRIWEKLALFVQTVPHAPILLSHKYLKRLILEK